MSNLGSISRLKMNSEKNKVIWIRRKKYSKDKLNTTIDLTWGNTKFQLLGLDFDVNLNDMTVNNFNKAITQCKNTLINWNKRYLTPIGKITVIKTFVISKINHLFICLPTPKPSIIKELVRLY